MKLNLLIGLSLLSLFTMSCEQEELVEPTSSAPTQTTAMDATFSSGSRLNLLSEAVFEPTLSTYFRKQVFTTYGFASSQDFVRNGTNAARFEMRNGDGQIRSEILLPSEAQSNRWYGNSLYLPSESWVNDYNPEGWDIITQWHATEDPGEASRLPPLALTVNRGRMTFVINWATSAINTNATVSGKKVFDLGPVEKDKWIDLVYHINFSHLSDGVLEIWKNGVKVVDYKGPNCYNDIKYPYFKAGIYKRNWYSVTKRVLYLDELRTGSGDASYQDVAPTGCLSIPTVTPTDTSVVQPLTFKLINANSNLPLLNLTNESILDLAALPTSNINIAAFTSTPVGSVKFALSGAKTQSVIQSSAPYSLFGYTNGNSNSWSPTAGTYKLTVTTYSGANGTGTVEATTTVNFKVVNNATDGTGTPSATLVINNNEASTTSTQATLSIKAVNATHMRFYDNSNSKWTAWEPAAATRPWTLSSGAGSKWVKIQVKNVAGVLSASSSDGIILK